MYPITSIPLELYQKEYTQKLKIVFNGKNADLLITDNDINADGFSINRYVFSGNKIEFGTTIASELSIVLNNATGKFTRVTLEGGDMFVYSVIKKWDAHSWENAQEYEIPLGKFTIDTPPRMLDVIQVSALDQMVLFDKEIDSEVLNSRFVNPPIVGELLSAICSLCNVTLATTITNLTNYNVIIPTIPQFEQGTTYRQLLSWICEITGTCAYMDWNGHLRLEWFSQPTALSSVCSLTTENRYSSDLLENAVTLTGLQYKKTSENGENIIAYGSDEYAISFSGNLLIDSLSEEAQYGVISSLYDKFNGFTYMPYTQTAIIPLPYLYPLDTITFVDKNGNEYYSIISNVTYKLNNNMTIEGRGETATLESYAAANPLTSREQTIIQTFINQKNAPLNARIQNALAFNELITNAFGLFRTDVISSGGSTIIYLHNAEPLEESQIIFTFNAGGFAWTDTGWNNGNPVWQYGVTSSGTALFKYLSAEGIDVSNANNDYHVQITPSKFEIYYKEMLVTVIEKEEMTIPKIKTNTYLEIGNVRFVPHIVNGVKVGANIIVN